MNCLLFTAMKPRPEIQHLSSVPHGAPNYAELEDLGLSADQVIDFSTNSNPYGPSPKVQTAINEVVIDRYPDRDCLSLRRALSAHHNLSPGKILGGNGTAELIWLVALTYLQPGDRVLTLGPTFGEYANASALMGAEIHNYRALAEEGFAFDTSRIEQILERDQFRLVFLCNPNNPTGQVLSLDAVNQWVQDHPQTLFVVDEAYINFTQDIPSAVGLQSPNILVLRSMTKDYALAGLRLGYAIGNQEIIQALKKSQPPWSVNVLAQVAGLAALEDQAHLQLCLKQVRKAKDPLIEDLIELGFSPVPSQVHFFLLPVEDGAAFRSRLLEKGIQVRDCASFGLPDYVRIATRRPDENQQLLKAIQKIET